MKWRSSRARARGETKSEWLELGDSWILGFWCQKRETHDSRYRVSKVSLGPLRGNGRAVSSRSRARFRTESSSVIFVFGTCSRTQRDSGACGVEPGPRQGGVRAHVRKSPPARFHNFSRATSSALSRSHTKPHPRAIPGAPDRSSVFFSFEKGLKHVSQTRALQQEVCSFIPRHGIFSVRLYEKRPQHVSETHELFHRKEERGSKDAVWRSARSASATGADRSVVALRWIFSLIPFECIISLPFKGETSFVPYETLIESLDSCIWTRRRVSVDEVDSSVSRTRPNTTLERSDGLAFGFSRVALQDTQRSFAPQRPRPLSLLNATSDFAPIWSAVLFCGTMTTREEVVVAKDRFATSPETGNSRDTCRDTRRSREGRSLLACCPLSRRCSARSSAA